MTCIILWSSFRSGSHQLRSMLREEKTLQDQGESISHHPKVIEQFCMQIDEHPKKVLLFNIKFGLGMDIEPRIEAVRSLPDARVLVLHRRDLLAQQASWQFALENGGAFTVPAETAKPVTLDPVHVGKAMFHCATQLRQLELNLPPLPFETLAYEDLSVARVQKALGKLLGRDVKVVEADTRKSAPRKLEDFVINLNPALKDPTK